MTRLELTAELIEEDNGGYTVYCPELDIYTQGDNEEEAINNLKEAAELHIEEVGFKNLKLHNVKEEKIELMVGV